MALTKVSYSMIEGAAVNVLDFGSDPTGVADSTAAFTAAALAAAGKDLYVPAGTYKLTDEVSIAASTNVIGDGYGSLIIQYTVEKNIFNLAANCTVTSLHLRGNNSLSGANFAKNNGIYASGVEGIKIIDNYLEQFEFCGIQLRDCFDYVVQGNFCFNNLYGNPSASDIVIYSLTAGGRGIISSNHCLSNNSQGILFNSNGVDVDSIISHNICVTLNSSFAEVASGGIRRHGIVAQYSSGINSRLVVSNNICRNTIWTGIYATSSIAVSGPVTITGNLCSNNGYAAGNTISGGIYCDVQGGSVNVTGNIVDTYQNDTTGAINLTCSGTNLAVNIVGNSIRTSAVHGIFVTGNINGVNIVGNQIYAPTLSGIYCVFSGGDATLGNLKISDNYIIRTVAYYGIYVDEQSSTKPILITDNMIVGTDNTTVAATNAGVFCKQYTNFRVNRNTINKFYYGFNSGSYQAATRNVDTFTVDYNIFQDCNTAIMSNGASSAGCKIYEGNTFLSCTTKIGAGLGGLMIGYVGSMDGTRMVIYDLNAAPSVGTWAVGDRVEYTTPTAGGFLGSVCTTAGNPGTWRTFGAIS